MGDLDVVYERRGAGEPLVLLHGIGHHWRAWLPVLDRLAEVHDVIAIDLPGFGGFAGRRPGFRSRPRRRAPADDQGWKR